jgi:hypothetical protein
MEVFIFSILDRSKGNCLGFKVSGEAQKEDYQLNKARRWVCG